MAYDPFGPYSNGAAGSALASFVVEPSDTTDLPSVVRAVVLGTAGTVRWRGRDGSINNTAPLPAGFILPIQAVRIHATGTSATGLTGLV